MVRNSSGLASRKPELRIVEERKLGGILFGFYLDGLCMCGALDLHGDRPVDEMRHFANSERLDGDISGIQTTEAGDRLAPTFKLRGGAM